MRRGLRCATALALTMLVSAGRVPAQRLPEVDRATLERLVRERPTDAELRVALAATYLGAADTTAAEQTLRRALDVPGVDRRRITLALGELLGVAGRFRDGESLLATLPDDADARRLRARLLTVEAGELAVAGRLDAADPLWRRATALDPALAEPWANLAITAARAGQRDSAQAILLRGLRYAPSDARLLALRATLMPSEASVAAAVRGLREERRTAPSEANGLALASLLRQQGDAAALLALLDTLGRDPAASAEVFRLTAELRRARGETDLALTVLTRGVERHPREASLHAEAAETHRAREEWRLAAQAWMRAIERAADPVPYEFSLAETYAESGDTLSARNQLAPLAAVSRPPLVLHRAAARLRALGDTAAAESAWRARLAVDARDAAALVGLAEITDARGLPGEAEPLWRRAEPFPESGPWPALALVRRTSGDEQRTWARRALWRGLEALAGSEQRVLGALEGGVSVDALARARPDLQTREALIAALEPLVDSLAADEAWGAEEIAEALRAWRGSPVLQRAQARAAMRQGRAARGVALYEQILRQLPGDAALRIEAGRAFATVGRRDEARALIAVALDYEPEQEAPFRALLEVDRSPEALAALERQVVRLRLRLPGSVTLADRHVELLHRMGRSEEAARVAEELRRMRVQQGLDPLPEGQP